MTNYSREVFLQVNSDERLKEYLLCFAQSLRDGLRKADNWKRRLPLIYNLFVYPILTRHQKKTHFGQVVPIEDIENILDGVGSVIRLPCVCRKVNTGQEKRVCYAIGMDISPILQDVPDFRNFDRITPSTAKAEMRRLDTEGLTHSVWTFQTPFIGAICNCDQDCMAYRIQHEKELAKVMWKAEYIAAIDIDRCKGCRMCQQQCMFDAVRYDLKNRKCTIHVSRCYGCGVCRESCPEDAIRLTERSRIAQTANLW